MDQYRHVSGVRVCVRFESHGRWAIQSKFRVAQRIFTVANCTCGEVRIVDYTSMKNGQSHSCGCQRVESLSDMWLMHGESGNAGGNRTTEYSTWASMIHRCYTQGSSGYENYGGRGIQVCDEWRRSYKAFLADMGRKPSPLHSLDRFPDVNGNYEPSNCRWATAKEQANNRRNSFMVTIGDETKAIQDWASEIGIVSGNTAWQRIRKGWDAEKALRTPSFDVNRKFVTVGSETKTVQEWSAISGVASRLINTRLRSGVDPEEAIWKKSNRG